MKADPDLPDVLDQLARLLRAGQGLGLALQTLSEGQVGPFKRTLGQLMVQHQHGQPLDHALKSLIQDSSDTTWRMVLAAFQIHRESGGNLASLLNRVAVSLRERELLRREIKTHTTEARWSLLIVGTLPLIILVFQIARAPEAMSVFWHNSLGHWLCLISGLALLLGGVISLSLLRSLDAP